MNEQTWFQVLNSASGNPKFKIANLKWLGIVTLVITFVMCGAVAQAHQPKKVPLIGYLSPSDPGSESSHSQPIQLALRDRGYIEGQNIAIDYRYAEGKFDRSLSLRPSWCVSRLMSSWQQEDPGWSKRPRMRPRRFPSLWRGRGGLAASKG